MEGSHTLIPVGPASCIIRGPARVPLGWIEEVLIPWQHERAGQLEAEKDNAVQAEREARKRAGEYLSWGDMRVDERYEDAARRRGQLKQEFLVDRELNLSGSGGRGRRAALMAAAHVHELQAIWHRAHAYAQFLRRAVAYNVDEVDEARMPTSQDDEPRDYVRRDKLELRFH